MLRKLIGIAAVFCCFCALPLFAILAFHTKPPPAALDMSASSSVPFRFTPEFREHVEHMMDYAENAGHHTWWANGTVIWEVCDEPDENDECPGRFFIFMTVDDKRAAMVERVLKDSNNLCDFPLGPRK